MNHEQMIVTGFLKRHRFSVFIFGALLTALLLVAASLSLYISSGTVQLDLSRPGYEKIRTQIQNNDASFKAFPSTGTLDDEALTQFETEYDERLKAAESVDAFGNDVLSPASLQIDQ